VGKGSVINLHTHSTFSDGVFGADRIVEKATAGGLTHIAITDHFATTKVCSLQGGELDDYLETIRHLGRKYDGTIEVLAGVEVDANPDRTDLENLPIDFLDKLDFVLFEHVNEGACGGAELGTIGRIASELSVPCGLAHPDFETAFAGLVPSEVAEELASLGLFVELNTASPYRRGGIPYIERAEEIVRAFRGMVRISIGTDAHRILSEVSNVGGAYAFVRRIGMMDDLLF